MKALRVFVLLLASCSGTAFQSVDDGSADAGALIADGGEPAAVDAGQSVPASAGAAGSGGAVSTPPPVGGFGGFGNACGTIAARSAWAVAAFPVNPDAPAVNAIDEDFETRWTTAPDTTQGNEWLAVTFPTATTLSGIDLLSVFEPGEAYAVSVDGVELAAGQGINEGEALAVMRIDFAERVTGTQLRVAQTGSRDGSSWSVYDLQAVCE
jgi:hypothetical protein